MHDVTTSAPAHTDRAILRSMFRWLVDPASGTGALASLRRSEPAVVLRQPSFHRLVRNVEDVALRTDGGLRWATAVHLLALLARPGTTRSLRDVGTALALAGFPESRLARLLASRGETFRDQATLAARFLRAHDSPCVPLDLAELALVEERAERRAERLRFRIARSYYRTADAVAPIRES
jgi:hypothetical protein